MQDSLVNERGSAILLAVGVIGVLAVLAVIVVSLANTEKWSAQSEYTHSRAFYSADAGSESGINWLRQQSSPPPIVDANSNVLVAAGFTALSNDANYRHDIRFMRKRFRPGWSLEYKDYEYEILADGASVRSSEAGVAVRAVRLYREGY